MLDIRLFVYLKFHLVSWAQNCLSPLLQPHQRELVVGGKMICHC